MLNIGIIGYGTIGQITNAVLCTAVKSEDLDVHFLDPKCQQSTPFDTLANKCNIIFIATPTPTKNGVVDVSPVQSWLNELTSKKYTGLVVVRSTVHYTTIEKYTETLNLIHWPAFSREHGDFEDAVQEHTTNIIGGSVNNTTTFMQYMAKIRPDLEFIRCPLKLACDVKLARNLYGAWKVLFWNFANQYFGESRAIYSVIAKLPPQGDLPLVGLDGELGYGGKCFPNNVDLLMSVKPDMFLEFMRQYNKKLQNKGE